VAQPEGLPLLLAATEQPRRQLAGLAMWSQEAPVPGQSQCGERWAGAALPVGLGHQEELVTAAVPQQQ